MKTIKDNIQCEQMMNYCCKNFGIKIPSGYGNNDVTALRVIFIGTFYTAIRAIFDNNSTTKHTAELQEIRTSKIAAVNPMSFWKKLQWIFPLLKLTTEDLIPGN